MNLEKKLIYRLRVKYNPTRRGQIVAKIRVWFWTAVLLVMISFPGWLIWKLSSGLSFVETVLTICGTYFLIGIMLYSTDRGFGAIPVRIIK